MEVVVFGETGEAMIVFPTSLGRCTEFQDRGMPEVLARSLDEGRLQLFCVDTVNADSWYDKTRLPEAKVESQELYERYLIEELVPLIRRQNPDGPLSVTGCSLGAYHAMNLALRHSHLFTRCISLGGAFDIRRFLKGHFDERARKLNPPDYLPLVDDPLLLDRYRAAIQFVLAVGERDFLVEENRRFAEILSSKQIPYRLDVWGDGAGHDWPWWLKMAEKHIGGA